MVTKCKLFKNQVGPTKLIVSSSRQSALVALNVNPGKTIRIKNHGKAIRIDEDPHKLWNRQNPVTITEMRSRNDIPGHKSRKAS